MVAVEPLPQTALPLPRLRQHRPSSQLQYAVVATRWLFPGMCAYLAAQAYLIPIVAAGPSWSLWPRLADLAVAVLGLALLLGLPRQGAIRPIAYRILVGLAVTWCVALASFCVSTLLLPRLFESAPPTSQGLMWGAYQLIRLGQFVLLYFVAAAVPITRNRRRILDALTICVLLFVCGGVILQYVGVLTTEMLVGHLPSDPGVSGPWASFGEDSERGLGTISYNHAYVGCQLMLLYVLRLSLSGSRFDGLNVGLLVLTLAAVFLCGSRASFGGMLVLVASNVWLWIQLGHGRAIMAWVTLLAVVLCPITVWPSTRPTANLAAGDGDDANLIARQLTTFEGYDAGNLAGRADIWSHRIGYLNERPWRWILGTGFGSAIVSGGQGHNQILNTIGETGVVGLAVAGVLAGTILVSLWKIEGDGRPLFWGSLALAVTSLTQETFYPVPALGHFLGFYLFTLAIALRMAEDAHHGSVPQRRGTQRA